VNITIIPKETIFVDPAVQGVYDTIVLGNIPGDNVAGAKAYAKGLKRPEREDFWPFIWNENNRPTPKQFTERYNCFIDGYDNAAKDPRYQVLHNLAKTLK
jgi:hypothetical protein